MACEPRLGLRVLAADVAREPGLVYDAVDVTRPPPARFSWRALYAATAAAAAAADERSGAGRALEPGDFSFEREIGVGAFGQVVLATHKKTGTRYAVKTISKKVLRRKKIAQRIWRQARGVTRGRAAARLGRTPRARPRASAAACSRPRVLTCSHAFSAARSHARPRCARRRPRVTCTSACTLAGTMCGRRLS